MQPLWKTARQPLSKLHQSATRPSNPAPGSIPQNSDIYTPRIAAALFTMSEKAEAAECLSADERINEKRSIRTAEYYSALTREDILTRVTTNEISQRQRHKY